MLFVFPFTLETLTFVPGIPAVTMYIHPFTFVVNCHDSYAIHVHVYTCSSQQKMLVGANVTVCMGWKLMTLMWTRIAMIAWYSIDKIFANLFYSICQNLGPPLKHYGTPTKFITMGIYMYTVHVHCTYHLRYSTFRACHITAGTKWPPFVLSFLHVVLTCTCSSICVDTIIFVFTHFSSCHFLHVRVYPLLYKYM